MKRFALFVIASVFVLYAAIALSKGIEASPPQDDIHTVVETPETASLALPATHGCSPINPDDYLHDCDMDLMWSPSVPFVYCPEGFDPECRSACLDAWEEATAATLGHTLADISACCEAYNYAVLYAGMVYDTDVSEAETSFLACNQSPARCEYLYCQKLSAAAGVFNSAVASASATRVACIAAAHAACISAIEGDTLNCIACMEACCY